MSLEKKFIHLRVHSSYSLAEGAIRIEELVEHCKERQIPAVAITDTGNLFGLLEFSLKAKSYGIKPIAGVQIKILYDTALNKLYNIALYAMNQDGLKNLLSLVSKSYISKREIGGNYITFDELKEHHSGLILLSGGSLGILGDKIQNESERAVEECVKAFAKIFDNTRFYIEISRHGLAHEKATEKIFLKLAENFNIPIVATNHVYFLEQGIVDAHDALLAIADGRFLSEEDRRRSHNEFYFKSQRSMAMIFSDLPEAIENSFNIAIRCSVMAEERKPMLPNFSSNEDSLLEEQSWEGLKKRIEQVKNLVETYKIDIQIYEERLKYELSVIKEMKYSGYFLIVSDFIKWAKNHDIPVGPGRGSGAGSLVAWVLDITELDPIKYGLLFERFLNPERVSMPDFDIDFCQEKRERVIEYIQAKYGQDKVAQIITFGKLQARAVIRDVGRVMQLPYSQVDRISKLVPFNPVNPVDLSQALEIEPMLKKARDSDPEISKLISIALKLEGLNRHASTHAAGILIGDRPLIEIIPLYKDDNSEMLVSQYSMKYAESAGLVKFDFLGLKTLSVISNCLNLLAERNIKINLSSISTNCSKTYELLSRGLAMGVFQFESPGMRDSLRKLKPDTIYDLIALGALYRPGPMDNIPTYIDRKHGREKIDYIHPKLEGVLKETFGVIIYQEQVIEIAKILAGYSLGSADLLRRAMGKKKKEEMDAQREQFIKGAMANKIDKQQAADIFDLVAKFAGYGFNKSHAAAYAMISYQTAYLKANYPVEFITSLINMEINDTDKIGFYVQDAKSLNIVILPPCINNSSSFFKPELLADGTYGIRYGLAALKSIGDGATDHIVQERINGGSYTSIENLFSRINPKTLNKRQVENLIKAGTLDILNPNRKSLLASVENILKASLIVNTEKSSVQKSLFDLGDLNNSLKIFNLAEVPDCNMNEKILCEHEALGFYLNDHPLDSYQGILSLLKIYNFEHYERELAEGNAQVTIAGVVVDYRTRSSKKGRFVTMHLSDSKGIYEATIFSDELLSSSMELLNSNKPLIMKVDCRKGEGGLRITIITMEAIDTYLAKVKLRLNISLNDNCSIKELLNILKSDPLQTKLSSSNCEISFSIESGYKIISHPDFATNLSDLPKLKELIGINDFYLELS